MRPASWKTITLVLATAAALQVPSWAQSTINARISGGGGSGKCTFEVVVDGIADVQIRYNQGYLQTKAGQPATWHRLDCNQPLPRYPNSFRFKGIDGRGRQSLLRDPNSNNGVAVIRIEDPKGGREGYTGDIMWSGGNNGGGNWGGGGGGWWNDNWNGGGGWNGNGGWNGGNNQWPGGNNNWSRNIVPNCQRDIRNKLVSQYGGNLNFQGTPSQNQAGSFVMVDGQAFYRDGSGRSGQIQYHCTMHPNGNVAESKYNVSGGNFPGAPQPR